MPWHCIGLRDLMMDLSARLFLLLGLLSNQSCRGTCLFSISPNYTHNNSLGVLSVVWVKMTANAPGLAVRGDRFFSLPENGVKRRKRKKEEIKLLLLLEAGRGNYLIDINGRGVAGVEEEQSSGKDLKTLMRKGRSSSQKRRRRPCTTDDTFRCREEDGQESLTYQPGQSPTVIILYTILACAFKEHCYSDSRSV